MLWCSQNVKLDLQVARLKVGAADQPAYDAIIEFDGAVADGHVSVPWSECS